jgi:hypothetical protein
VLLSTLERPDREEKGRLDSAAKTFEKQMRTMVSNNMFTRTVLVMLLIFQSLPFVDAHGKGKRKRKYTIRPPLLSTKSKGKSKHKYTKQPPSPTKSPTPEMFIPGTGDQPSPVSPTCTTHSESPSSEIIPGPGDWGIGDDQTPSSTILPGAGDSPSGCANLSVDDRRDALREAVIAVSGADVLMLPESSQSQALAWLADQDSLKVCPGDTSFLQRYALAVLYFATVGDQWFHCDRNGKKSCAKESFLSGVDECLWGGLTCEDAQNVSNINIGKHV